MNKKNNKSEEYFYTAKEKEQLGLYEEALEYYRKSIEEDDNNIEAYFGFNLMKSYLSMLKNNDDKYAEIFDILNEFINDKK